ncbi:putative ATPase [Dysgonomonadaceae bacterium PH5-43]|nr:putative ATPase [Dysgonomonadaceae bacterium PH5-43]
MFLPIKEIRLKENCLIDDKVYPFNIPVIKKFKQIKFEEPVTFIIGENGSGKSTLIEAFAILCGFNPEGGSRNLNFTTMASHSKLHEYLRVARSHIREKNGYFLRAETYYNVATEIENLDKEGGSGPPIKDSYGGKSLHEQSHGESFWALLKHRLSGDGLYIFDEPEAALSPMRLLSLLVRIDDLVKQNSQFIISTHSPILLMYPNAIIYEIENGELKPTKLQDTQHYAITKYCMQNPDKMLNELGIIK